MPVGLSAKGSALLPGVLAAQAKKRIEKKRNAHKGHCASLIFGRSGESTDTWSDFGFFRITHVGIEVLPDINQNMNQFFLSFKPFGKR